MDFVCCGVEALSMPGCRVIIRPRKLATSCFSLRIFQGWHDSKSLAKVLTMNARTFVPSLCYKHRKWKAEETLLLSLFQRRQMCDNSSILPYELMTNLWKNSSLLTTLFSPLMNAWWSLAKSENSFFSKPKPCFPLSEARAAFVLTVNDHDVCGRGGGGGGDDRGWGGGARVLAAHHRRDHRRKRLEKSSKSWTLTPKPNEAALNLCLKKSEAFYDDF